MEILKRKIVVAALTMSMAVAVSQGIAAPGKSQGAGGFEPSADHAESVVITMQSNPVSGYDPDPEDPDVAWEALAQSAEPACVALQIGINLLMDTVKVGDDAVAVTPADEVILFPTLDGVQVINPDNGLPPNHPDHVDGEHRPLPLNSPVCTTPSGPKSVTQLLMGFSMLGGQVVSCPLCTMTRGISEPNFGIIGNAVDIHELFLYADKVIDF